MLLIFDDAALRVADDDYVFAYFTYHMTRHCLFNTPILRHQFDVTCYYTSHCHYASLLLPLPVTYYATFK